MLVRIIVFAVLAMVCVGCGKPRESAQQLPESSIRLHCMIVQWHAESMDSHTWETDPPVLNQLDTFFFIDHPEGTKSTAREFRAGEPIRLKDTFGKAQDNRCVQVSGDFSGGFTRLEVSSAQGSTIQLDKTLHVELPEHGSTIIETANPIVDGRKTYVWLMAAQ